MTRLGTVLLLVLLSTAIAGTASAFCGFYVSGADGALTNKATMVVLMRDGTRTVLSMQNNYQGPPQDFAMIVPVPVVLQQENVRTLDNAVFGRIDALASPKLVEYWEQNPCPGPPPPEEPVPEAASSAPTKLYRARRGGGGDTGVRIEAQFAVGEYDIVILSARDSTGLETWLRREHYNIPAGASAALAPYVQSGMKFFVAKVNVERVTFTNGQATLSPLRFHYDSDTFSLPVRLGLLNNAGTQDLVVHILARGQRYDVANYANAFVPTNIDVRDTVRSRFAEFYAALFDKTLQQNPGAVITEYAWEGAVPEYPQTAATCDPCPPEPPVPAADLMTLGLDKLPSYNPNWEAGYHGSGLARPFVLTRLHYRYGADGLRDDLVFRAAEAITGGREETVGRRTWMGEVTHGRHGVFRVGATGVNQFQARYAIRHWWQGSIACTSPVRGVWGGPPDGSRPTPAPPATGTAFVPRGAVKLENMVRQRIRELGVSPAR